ncbi:hypothetical protein Scep_004383 [Stephania cephalantha]|uniref:Uncharacterized protein n=1 Tax=Stephania cephalantha TaxID=152367 RepID=A0AAP0PX93_9MAGN
MQLRVEFAFGEQSKEEYSENEEFVFEKEEEGVLFLYGDGEIDQIFFTENSNNLDEGPKFDDDMHNFIEDKVVFGDDGFVIKVVSHKNPQVLEVVVGNTIVNKSYVKDITNYHNFVVNFSKDKVKPSFKDKVLLNQKSHEDQIVFTKNSNNLDERPKFDDDKHNFIEDKVVFGDDSFVIKDKVKPSFKDKVLLNQKSHEDSGASSGLCGHLD